MYKKNILDIQQFKKEVPKDKSAIIFGGSFDPIHEGHINDIRILMDLSEVVFIAPTKQNPWKKDSAASLSDRLQMIKIALDFEQIEYTEKTDGNGLVLLNSPYVYSYSLVSNIKSIRNESLYWAIGEDLKDQAPEWKNWSDEGVPFVVIPLTPNISSTDVRKSSIPPHPAITNYIKNKNLYI